MKRLAVSACLLAGVLCAANAQAASYIISWQGGARSGKATWVDGFPSYQGYMYYDLKEGGSGYLTVRDQLAGAQLGDLQDFSFTTTFTAATRTSVDGNPQHEAVSNVTQSITYTLADVLSFQGAADMPQPMLLDLGTRSVKGRYYPEGLNLGPYFGTSTFNIGLGQKMSIYGGIRLTLVDSIPEPASWAMMVAGFGLVGRSIRRVRRPIRSA